MYRYLAEREQKHGGMDLWGLSKQHPLLYSNKAFVAQWEEEGISGEVGKTLVLCQFTFLHFIIVRFYLPVLILLYTNSFSVASSTRSVEELRVFQIQHSFIPDTMAGAHLLQKKVRRHIFIEWLGG